MHQDFCSSSYKRYKEDTNIIASWLKTTAETCGYCADSSLSSSIVATPEQKNVKKGKKKRNKRSHKEAKAAQAEAKAKSNTPRSPNIIERKDFIPLAEFVSSSSQWQRMVPPAVAIALDRNIILRKAVGEFVKSQVQSRVSVEGSDRRHTYFIDVLEQVKEILQPRLPKLCSNNASTSVAALTDSLTGLVLEEPRSDSISTTSDLDVSCEVEKIEDFEEFFLAFHLLLHDFSKLRKAVSSMWAGYRGGKYGLTAVSVTTDTAIAFARSLEQDISQVWDKHVEISQLLEAYYRCLCSRQNEDVEYREAPEDDLNFRTYDAAESVMWPTYRILESFVGLLDPGVIPICKTGGDCRYKPSSTTGNASSKEKYLNDKALLLQILPEFVILCRGTDEDGAPAEDELIRGLRIAFKTHKIPLWTVLAMQILLDIHEVLKEDVARGMSDLQEISAQVYGSLEEHFKFHKTLTIENWPKINDRNLRSLQDRIQGWVWTDPLQEACRRLGRPIPEKHCLMKNHPVFCGLFAYSLQVLFQEAGIMVANAWGSILYTCHLYNAVSQVTSLQKPWEDMEILFSIQNSYDLFHGERPPTVETMLEKYLFSMGASKSSVQHCHSDRLRLSDDGPRKLEEQATVSRMFKRRYCHASKNFNFNIQDLKVILEEANVWEKNPSVSRSSLDQNGMRTLELIKSSNNKSRKRKDSIRQLTTVDLLGRLCDALQGEILELGFDYMRFHRFCWGLLRLIKEGCDGQLQEIYGPKYLERQNQLPFVVGYIFMAAVNAENFMTRTLKVKRRNIVTYALLQKAAAYLDQVVTHGAGSIVANDLKSVYGIIVAS
ncbi:hypothetical protein MPH_13947 [Macrophomina phaseolina MS6]|uniref:DUF6604 domain-containing protein n=1 Tax=Macrophomina phaseolina (strain MS6) TaxID=1126212 RepID=K2QH59_MACPH|nr:hypothetical protein MPH_13947 [Macrophomina phaseolina MS6]